MFNMFERDEMRNVRARAAAGKRDTMADEFKVAMAEQRLMVEKHAAGMGSCTLHALTAPCTQSCAAAEGAADGRDADGNALPRGMLKAAAAGSSAGAAP